MEEEEIDQKCLVQYVINVEKIVKYHSDHQETNQYIVVNVLKKKAGMITEEETLETEEEDHLIEEDLEKKDRCSQ